MKTSKALTCVSALKRLACAPHLHRRPAGVEQCPFCPQDSAHPPPLVMATLGQDDRSSIHINLRKTSFPNISSHSEGDRPRQKVGNDFCVFTFQRVLGFLHMAVHTTRRAIQKSRNTDLGNSLSTPWTYLGRGEAAVFSCMYYLEYVFFFF